MNAIESLTLASSMAMVVVVVNVMRKMTERTQHSLRFGLVMLGTGSLSTVIGTAFPQIAASCGGVEFYQWMIPFGAAVLMLTDRRRLGG